MALSTAMTDEQLEEVGSTILSVLG